MNLSVRLSETIFPNFDKIAFTAPIMRCHIEIVIFIVGRLGKIYLLLSLFVIRWSPVDRYRILRSLYDRVGVYYCVNITN